MRAILVFKLPQEAQEHQTAIDGMKWRGILQQLYNDWKYRDGFGDARAALVSAVSDEGLELFD